MKCPTTTEIFVVFHKRKVLLEFKFDSVTYAICHIFGRLLRKETMG